jgi:HAE1 family hydrophobic/amphiphilic exporter-1
VKPRNDSGSHFIVARPVAILMVFLAAVVFGYLSLGRLPVTLMPELTYPTLTVRTVYPGAAPEEVENDIGRPIEEALGVVGGLQTISSINRAGVSDVVLEFTWDVEMSDATQDVLEKLDRVFLPVEAERPLILHFDPSLDPILELSLTGDGRRYEGEEGLRRLRRLADQQIKRELEPIKGVAAVQVRGGLEEEIHVSLDAAALGRAGISIQQVIDRLAQENINVAGGTLLEGRIEYMVRTLNEYDSLEQIEQTIVAHLEGRPVRVRDLGDVTWDHKEREILTRTDGNESVQIDIFKEADANIVAVADRVRQTLGEFEIEQARNGAAATTSADKRKGPGGPVAAGLNAGLYKSEGAFMKIVADRSRFIESSISDVKSTAIFGGFLAIAVLYLFLRNFKSTAIVAVSIPVSLLVTFAPLNSMGLTLNIMSLGGLALGIGMLVDSSIVVLESIYRCREEGDPMTQAVIRGTLEVRSAVVASTLTSVAVFFPMIFVEGIAGQAFGDLGFAVVFSLLASTAVALFFIPMVANRTALGLGTTGVVAGVLGISALASRNPRAAAAIGALFAVAIVIGWVTVAILALRGKLAGDPSTKKITGLWRWSSLSALREGFPQYRRTVMTLLLLPYKTTRLSRLASYVLWLPSALAGVLVSVLGLAYLVVIRFLLGSVLEWVVGKPGLIAVMGFAAFTRRALVPAVATVFRVVTWVPARLATRVLSIANDAYPRVLRGALAHPGIVVIVMAVCVWIAWDVGTSLDSELLPEVHQGEFTVEVQLPVGTPLQETDRVTAPVEQAILAEREHIESLILTVGYDSANSARSDEGEHSARFKVVLDENSRAAEIESKVVERLRARFAEIPDLDARVVRPVLFSSKTAIEVEIYGTDLNLLREYGDLARAQLERLPQLADVETTMRPGAPEVQIVYDRDKLALYELNISTVARQVRDKVKGFEATRFNLTDRRIPILVRLRMDDRETVEDVANLIVNPGGERPIPLSAVADVTLGEGPSEVRRVDGSRVALIRANLSRGSLSAAAESIRETLRNEIAWPAQLGFDIRGQSEEWERSQRSLLLALGLSLFMVYVIMAVQFESLVHPLVIMLTIPLAFVGTFVTLKILNLNLSVVVFLGMIMLAGIVVNNAIVLVDYINTLRSRNMDKHEAILTAGAVRLRPILMTTATTVLGLVPLALGIGDGAELRSPMAIAVISGLITSTALTLIVIPTIYSLLDGMVAWVARARSGKHDPAAQTLVGGGIDSVRP